MYYLKIWNTLVNDSVNYGSSEMCVFIFSFLYLASNHLYHDVPAGGQYQSYENIPSPEVTYENSPASHCGLYENVDHQPPGRSKKQERTTSYSIGHIKKK